jgi:DNA repair protein RadA/Sms
MAKTRTVYFCQDCGYESAKWLGKCPSCSKWNTFVEEKIQKTPAKAEEWKEEGRKDRKPKPQAIRSITTEDKPRVKTIDNEVNRVLGGGIVAGSLVLIGGEPGIGKSTLMLQLALSLENQKVLYVAGEESGSQIKMRAERIGITNDDCYILAETETQNIFTQIKTLKPDLVVVDSIQTIHSSHLESPAGSVGQVRECAGELMKYAKESGVPVFLIGHITKDGGLAGPKVLEHMVDTVLQFEGDRNMTYRILRTIKNRFGSTSEIGIYEMQGAGLRQVENPSEILINQRDGSTSGVAITASLEGNRPLLVEMQALVSNAAYGTPQRSSTGYDAKRLNMLLAVLEKRGGFRLGMQDVFINIAGGIKIADPAIDLAICSAVISSLEEICIPSNVCFAGEVGLGGEIRAVNRIENRIAEAQKLGFEKFILSKYNKIEQDKYAIEFIFVSKITDVISELFG